MPAANRSDAICAQGARETQQQKQNALSLTRLQRQKIIGQSSRMR